VALLVDATTAQHTRGIGTVIAGIVPELARGEARNTIIAVGPDFPDAGGVAMQRVALARTRIGRLLFQRLLLPLDVTLLGLRSRQVDRVLVLDAYLPVVRPQRGVRYAALVHDVLPLTHPHFWPPSKRAVKRAAFASLRRSDATIFTSTEHNASAIRRLMQRDAHVVRFGCGQLTDAEADDALEKPLPERGSHLLYVGAFEPRKNVIGLVDVFEHAVANLDTELSLILIGEGARDYVRALTERVARSPLRDSIRVIGSADRTTALRTMRTAQALLFPSSAEGFGLPIVEALALGTPVVASDLPEIRSWADDAILYASPSRAAGWIQSIETAIAIAPARRRTGQELARDYRWRKCAADLLAY
jgi:glycosyltransferase involved in cell wall biosynthesis